jgi:hypothetical protein
MSLLGRFTKQPAEVLDYDVDFTDFFEGRTDTPASFSVVAEPGITVIGSSRSGNVVKVLLSGGTDGTAYKVTVLLTTTTGVVREADFQVTVKAV